MRKPKENVSVEKLELLVGILRDYELSIEKTIKDCREANVLTFTVEGWPTLVRGLNFMIDQGVKITGPASPLARVSPETLLMPGQEYYPTRKPTKPSKAVAKAHKQVAEAKKPYKKPPKDTPEP